ncbi:MAG: ABC-type polysaccharide/polyol phosphate export system, permease component [Parcubacteria group bacterium GW2011_GWD2_38_12]|nr:MAG: ABC-type polysaccharide/polyol phosphate export system, permease component [Parcubacteria group bacterium GW2011_GWC2_36_17]KKQ39154.1 MAG: ABC-type polysaccharide/polyol phosphate export system, permease component [Candidatus Moranbacteria bacterium GW2011_GWF2_37_7]KKQ52469.1 MAG: ABC-type polysaccharide/polyol phosphate export system, permease component [Parcubacteria group bacterium GW2011_GWD2_38_12]KKQ58363.1 MAG: ABC-type polysaccharide/polyol phosphate export system, permease com
MTKKIKYYKELIWELTKNELKLRYSGSVLGFIWVFLKPFMTFAILFMVFSVFFGQHDPYYKFNLLIGLVLFYYFSEGTIQLTDTLLKRADIILKLNFPRFVVIVSSLLSTFINFLASLSFFFVLVFLFSKTDHIFSMYGLLMFVIAVIFLSLLILGFGLFSSIIQVKLRDFQQIWSLFIQLLMYSTPIIYPLTILPDKLQKIILLNPLTIIIDFSRSQLLNMPLAVSLNSVIILAVFIILLNVAGYYYFNNRIKIIAENI